MTCKLRPWNGAGVPVGPPKDEIHVGTLLDLLVDHADVVLDDGVVKFFRLPAKNDETFVRLYRAHCA